MTSSKRIRDRAFDARAIIINERFWNRLRNELLDLLKDQGPLVLYHMRASYGFETGVQGAKERDVCNPIFAVLPAHGGTGQSGGV